MFTDKKYIRRASYVLVPLMAINAFVGCTRVDKNSTVKNENNGNDISIEIVDNTKVQGVLDDYVFEEEKTDEQVKRNVFEVLSEKINTFNGSFDTVLCSSDRGTDLYASALYAKAKSFGLDDSTIIRELENIICYGTQAMCVSDEVWMELFGNLVGTISMYDNVIDYYYPLAAYVHRYSCELEHSSLYFDLNRITCDNIERMYEEKNPPFDYSGYVKEMVLASEDEMLIKKLELILNSNVNFETVLYELENVYYFSTYPTDFDENIWNQLFGNLVKTVPECENVCLYYYDLAFFTHCLWCDFEHSRNEFGVYQCNDVITLEK